MISGLDVPREEEPEGNNEEDDTFSSGFDTDARQITVEELCSKLSTDLCFGLSKATAEAYLARDGKNEAVSHRKGRRLFRILRSMFQGVTLLLWFSAGVCVADVVVLNVSYDEKSPAEIYLLVALVFNALFIGAFALVQGKRVDSSRAALTLSGQTTEVIRDGKTQTIPTEDIVVGDLILLRFGERIPADVMIVESQNFKVDNFALTGVHEPQALSEKVTEANPTDNHIAYFSGEAVEGIARGIVIRTGRRTLMARIFEFQRENATTICPITKKILHCLNVTAVLAILLGFTFFWVFWALAAWRRTADSLLVLVVVLTAVVPENLLRTLVLSCSIYARRMSNKSCVVNSNIALQRLPFVDTICLNMPGILTQNKTNVMNLWYDRKAIEIWAGSRMVWKEKSSSTFKELARCAVLCNDAQYLPDQEEVPLSKKTLSGEQKDVAILRLFLSTIGKKVDVLRRAHPKVFWQPPNPAANCNSSIHKTDDGYLLIMVGPPELLAMKCATYAMEDKTLTITEKFRTAMDKACVHFAKLGETMLCIIQQYIQRTTDELDIHHLRIPDGGFRFVGMFTLSDPLRPRVTRAVNVCRKAGIKVILATDDHPITARSFARHIGVISDDGLTMEEAYESPAATIRKAKRVTAVIVDCTQLRKMSKKGIEELMTAYPEVVFARSSPLQKLMLVAMCQKDGGTVAVVGDGIHDVVAMKKADLSITLCDDQCLAGLKTDIYLTEESISSLATCIEEGRTVLVNLKKAIAYTLTSTVPAVLSVLAYCLLKIPMPASPIGLLISEFITDAFPAVALVFEKSDASIMTRTPRDIAQDRLWSRQMVFYSCCQMGVIETFGCFFTYFVIMLEFGWTPLSLIGIRDSWDSRAVTDLEDVHGQRWTYQSRKDLEAVCQTGFFFSLVVLQCANVLICRTQDASIFRMRDRNWMVHFGLLFSVSASCFFIYLPYVSDFAKMKPLRPLWWLLPVPFFLFMIVYDEVKKYIVRRSPKGWLARETVY